MKKYGWALNSAIIVVVAAAMVSMWLLFPRGEDTDVQVNIPDTAISLVYAYQNSQWSACLEEIIRDFEADHPGIEVKYEIRYEDEVYEETLNKLIARDELGDIVQLKEPSRYAESGIIAPLPEALSGMVSTVYEQDGHCCAVAALGATTGILYNKTLFQRYGLTPPKTYEQFLNLCAALKHRGVIPLGVGGKDLWHFEYWMNHFFRTNVLSREPEFLSLCSAGERTWNDPAVTDMLTHLGELFRRGYVDENWPSTPDGALAYHMAKGEVAMVFSGPWLGTNALSIAPELELGWFYVPDSSGRVVAGESKDVFWAVTADCAQDPQRYEAATSFLEYFYSHPVYESMLERMWGYSTLSDESRGIYAAEGFGVEILDRLGDADLRISGYIGDENTPIGFEKYLLSLISRLCAGEYTVAEVQELAQQHWELCLSQERSYEP